MRQQGDRAATILVCDDEAVLRSLIRAALDDRFSLVEADDGDKALALARSAKPDLILLDMMMPGRSGLEVLAGLRSDGELAETPVVMLSARTQADDRREAEAAGATRFLAKPFSPGDLVTLVEELVPEA